MRRILVAAALAAAAVGCGPRMGTPVHQPERATVAGRDVTDEAFSVAVRDLILAEPASSERALRLAPVVRRQLARSLRAFDRGGKEAGLRAFAGAMYLARGGELTASMLEGDGRAALERAVVELAQRGEEGRAQAVYEMLLRVLPERDKADARSHLAAIAAWVRDTSRGGPMVTAGAAQQAAVSRQLLEPSDEARRLAIKRTSEWLDRALSIREAYRERRASPGREEANEALRALGTGPSVLAAVHVRHGDARSALSAIEDGAYRELARPDLLRVLGAVNREPGAASWLEVARFFRPPPQAPQEREGEDDLPQDRELLFAAAFASLAEAYRLDAAQPEVALNLGAALLAVGMAEAAPAVVSTAAKAHPDARVLSAALSISLRAMVDEIEADDPAAAARAFRAAGDLLALADASELATKVQPSSARIRATMGEVEVRRGNLTEARALFERSLAREPSGAVEFSLARIDAHEGKEEAALAHLRAVLASEDGQRDSALRGEARYLTAEIHRRRGQTGPARDVLLEALRDLAKARTAGDGNERARVERVLARVLDRLGAAKQAARALDRAFDATPADKHQMAATIGEMVGRAVVRADLDGARAGLDRALAADIDHGDIAYYAAWVRLLERQKKVPLDVTLSRVLDKLAQDKRWTGRVVELVTGRLAADAFAAKASAPVERAEASFYLAMERKVAGDAAAVEKLLRAVVAAPGLDLLETSIARDLLDGDRITLPGAVPDVGLP